MARVRILTVVALLALTSGAAAETFEVGPSVGTSRTTATVFQKGKTYRITITGTIDVVFDINKPNPPYHETYDAFYCKKTDWPQRKEYCDANHPEASINGVIGSDAQMYLNAEPGGGFVPYRSDHSYTRKYTAVKNGRAVFTTRPYGSTPDTQTWSGVFTVTIVEPGARVCLGVASTIVGEEEPGEINRIIGTPEGDVIVGTNSDDLILGGGGNDIVCGLGGNDVINGGGGQDALQGGGGRDRIVGGVGDFTDALAGGSGDDRLSGGEGGDRLAGNAGDDILDGGEGNSDDDRDRLDGGPGDDELISRHRLTDADYGSSPAPITLDLAAGTARGWGKDSLSGAFRVFGSRFGDTLRGSPQSDIVLGGKGNDIIDGRGDDDFLYGDQGKDRITGGTGADQCQGEELFSCEVGAMP